MNYLTVQQLINELQKVEDKNNLFVLTEIQKTTL
jgi:hypothetical protein